LLFVYEAGPCGYTLARELKRTGYHCEVVAPSKVPRRPGNRVKTDRRDALTLAGLARAGELTFVTVPDERDEAMRDLSRARIDGVRARLKARQQLKALLLRHGRRYSGKTSWNPAHERYLATVSFDHRAQDIAFVEYRQAVSQAHGRVERLSEALAQELEHWRMRPLVRALMTLRGVDQLAATTLVAELGELKRFAHPRELMGYLGLVPSEHSTGEKRRLGAITKTGNGHARRVLIEAAWNYRFSPRITLPLQKRQEQQPADIRAIAWRAQLRLNHRYRQLTARRVQHNKTCVAIARELAGFLWSIGQRVTIPA
jgi:transposase